MKIPLFLKKLLAHVYYISFKSLPIPMPVKKFWNSIVPTPVHRLFSPIYRFETNQRQKLWASHTENSIQRPPQAYEHVDSDSYLYMGYIMKSVEQNSSILDMCCNCGRHLFVLWEKGYKNLHGVDINPYAIEYSKKAFPNIQNDVSFTVSSLELFLSETPSSQYDIVYTVGTSIEMVDPSFPLVYEMCRIAKNYCFLFVKDDMPPYPRHWEFEFLKCGAYLVFKEALNDPQKRAYAYCFKVVN